MFTFNSCLVLQQSQIEAAAKGCIKVVYLWGSAEQCLASFLAREKQTGRKLDEAHWHRWNAAEVERMGADEFRRYRIKVFDNQGLRKTAMEIYRTILQL